MNLLILGSIALDSIKTPSGDATNVLGGAAVYASISASNFVHPMIVGVVGSDFPQQWIDLLVEREIDISGLKIEQGKTFHWSGRYKDFNKAITLETHLNVFEYFNPILSERHKCAKYALLGNIDPIIQNKIINQLSDDTIVALDTMNFWIDSKKDELLEVITKTNILFVNEDEAKLLSGEKNIFSAVKMISTLGPISIIIKRGEYGSFIYNEGKYFFVPAYPVKSIIDPTGAGDTFAGAFMGYLDKSKSADFKSMKTALLYATVLSSFTIESYSTDILLDSSSQSIENRFEYLKEVISL